MDIIFMEDTNITAEISIKFRKGIHRYVKGHGIPDQSIFFVREVHLKERHIIHSRTYLASYGICRLFPFTAGFCHKIPPAAEGLRVGTNDFIGTRHKDGMEGTASSALFGACDMACADFETGIEPAVGGQGFGIGKTSWGTDIREPGKGGYLADPWSSTEDTDHFPSRDCIFAGFPIDGIYFFPDEFQIFRSVGGVGIVILILLFDNALDFIRKRLWAYVFMFGRMLGDKIFDNGPGNGIFGDACTAAYGNPEADDNVVDPVAALSGELLEMISFSDKNTEFLDLGRRDIRFFPYTGKVVEGQSLSIKTVRLPLGGAGQHGVDNGGLPAPGHQERHVVCRSCFDYVVERKIEIGDGVGMIPEDLQHPFFSANKRIPVRVKIMVIGKDLVFSPYVDVDGAERGMTVDPYTIGTKGLDFDTLIILGTDNDFRTPVRRRTYFRWIGTFDFWHGNETGRIPALLSHCSRQAVAAAGCL